jgi:hypothetical protein
MMSNATTTISAGRLPRNLQKLVDARLDTIDRMLLGRLPRADRLSVTRDVEAQIFDLLGERPGNELDREDVLTVLARLDPPEAYIPEEGGYEAAAVLLPAAAAGMARRPVSVDEGDRKRATVMGIIGLLVFGLVVLWPLIYLLAVISELGELALIGLLGISGLTLLASVPTLVLSILWRKGGNWATVGIVAGAFGLFFGPVSALIVFVIG